MKLRIYVIEQENGQVMALDEDSVQAEGFTDDDLTRIFEGKGAWCPVELHPPSHGRVEEARRAALVDNPQGGFTLDETRLRATRAAVMVKEWPAKWGEVSVKAFDALPPTVSYLLDALIVRALFPSVTQHEGFMNALKLKRQSSEAATSTP